MMHRNFSDENVVMPTMATHKIHSTHSNILKQAPLQSTDTKAIKPTLQTLQTQTVKSRAILGDISNRFSAIRNNNIVQEKQGKQGPLIEKQVKQENNEKVSKQSPPSPKTPMEVDTDEPETALQNTLQEIKQFHGKNAQMEVHLADDIMSYWKSIETRRLPNPQYMQRQTDLTERMREILIDWLVEVHHKFTLSQETLYLTVNIIDRFLERRSVSRGKLQLVGCTAMLLASKYEEICVPVVKDFVHMADYTYTREQFLAMESIMLSALQFNLTVPTALRFAQRFLTIGRPTATFSSLIHSTYNEDRPAKVPVPNNDDFYQYTAFYFIELTLQDYRFLYTVPSLIAASGVYLALHHCGEDWTPSLEEYSGYSKETMRACVTQMYTVAITPSKYRAVKKKYALPTYYEVSRQNIRCPFK